MAKNSTSKSTTSTQVDSKEIEAAFKSIPLEDDMGAVKREAYYYSIPSYLDLKTLREALDTKADDRVATRDTAGLLSVHDKQKLDLLDPNKEFIHPSDDGNRHLPPTGTSNGGKFVKAGNSPGEASWEYIRWSDITNKPTTVDGMGLTDASRVGHKHNEYAVVNHTHPKATNIMDGLLSKEDKQKLDSIQQGATNQNTFSNFKVENNILSADTVQDTIEFSAGSGIRLESDTELDRITINAEGFAAENHKHPEYALKEHTHAYASVNHNHDEDYAKLTGADFTGEVNINVLKLGGRRVFLQPTTPSMAKDGDIWLKF